MPLRVGDLSATQGWRDEKIGEFMNQKQLGRVCIESYLMCTYLDAVILHLGTYSKE
jgi:hypothetical protein